MFQGSTESTLYYFHIYCKPGRTRPSGSWGASLQLKCILSLYNFNGEFQSPHRARTASMSAIKSSPVTTTTCSSCCSALVSPVNYKDVSVSEESLRWHLYWQEEKMLLLRGFAGVKGLCRNFALVQSLNMSSGNKKKKLNVHPFYCSGELWSFGEKA